MMTIIAKRCFLLLGFLCLSACGEREGLAPVVELNWREANNHATQHEVMRGETLYAIAFRYDQDYRQLAITNHLQSPYTLRVGQILRFQPDTTSIPISTPPSRHYATPRYTPIKPVFRKTAPASVKQSYNRWQWPIHGRVEAAYSPQQGKKGIDIAGRKGERVLAASSGVVAYAGSGLAGYGNLIIIKHDNQYLTAYGNNLRNLVREGQHIQTGQAIAEIGVVDRRYWGVHFEIRQAGKPVNPLNYLQKG